MIGIPSTWKRITARCAGGLVAPALLALIGGGSAAELPPPGTPVVTTPAATVPVLDLAACQQIALERQPSVAAARASLAAAVARAHALDHLRFGGVVFARDLPVRRQQAALGVCSYEAALRQAEADARYAVTYSYLAALYAHDQEEALLQARKNLDKIGEQLKEFVDNKQHPRFIKKEHLSLIEAYRLTIDAHREETIQGRQRALAALREALGVGPDCAFELALTRLPVPVFTAPSTTEEVIALAKARRGEIQQTETAVRVSCLEITAQGKTFLPSLRTFASGSDLHAQPVPTGSKGLDYKPGGLAPEMPGTLVGSRGNRVDQATIYHGRAEAVAEKTRQLIALEAEDAFLRLREFGVKQDRLKQAEVKAAEYSALISKQFEDSARDGFKFDPKMEPPATRVEEVLNSGVTTARMRIDANQGYFDYLLSLALLERVTACGFVVEFRPAPAPAPMNGR